MKRTCGTCGREFEARSSRAKSCSSSCRGKAHYAKRKGRTLTVVPDIATDVRDGVVDAVTAELTAAGRIGTSMGQVCLVLARQIEAGAESSTGLTALSKELAARMSQVLADVEPTGDIVDELRAKRARRGAV